MSSCNRSADVLEYLLGLMDADKAQQFEEHLATCPDCRMEMDLEQMITRALGRMESPSHSLAKAVRMRTRLLPRHSLPWKPILAVAGMTAAVAVMVSSAITYLPPNLDQRLSAVMRILQRDVISGAGTGVLALALLGGVSLAALASMIAWVIPED